MMFSLINTLYVYGTDRPTSIISTPEILEYVPEQRHKVCRSAQRHRDNDPSCEDFECRITGGYYRVIQKEERREIPPRASQFPPLFSESKQGA